MKEKLYSRNDRPKLTFQNYQPLQGPAPSVFEDPFLLSVRLINHLQLTGLAQVAVPAHAWIQVVLPQVPATRIKKAMCYALRQTCEDLDVGKGKSDLSRSVDCLKIRMERNGVLSCGSCHKAATQSTSIDTKEPTWETSARLAGAAFT